MNNLNFCVSIFGLQWNEILKIMFLNTWNKSWIDAIAFTFSRFATVLLRFAYESQFLLRFLSIFRSFSSEMLIISWKEFCIFFWFEKVIIQVKVNCKTNQSSEVAQRKETQKAIETKTKKEKSVF